MTIAHTLTILLDGEEREVECILSANYNDTSFDHEFGTERQGDWEFGIEEIDMQGLPDEEARIRDLVGASLDALYNTPAGYRLLVEKTERDIQEAELELYLSERE